LVPQQNIDPWSSLPIAIGPKKSACWLHDAAAIVFSCSLA
jgi:hypothetical protein